MKIIAFFVCILSISCGLFSCRIEKAKPFKKQYLVIASDCLSNKDISIFKSFKKFEKIEIRIIHLSTDSIIKKLNKEGVSTDIDALILSSVYSMYRVDEENLLQKIQLEDYPSNIPTKHISTTRSWSGIGIDPFLIRTLDDTLFTVRNYNDLLIRNWCDLSNTESSWSPFYSFVAQKIQSNAKYTPEKWINDFVSNKIDLNSNDSTFCKLSVCRQSDLPKKVDNKKAKRMKTVYPNQRTGGYYYDMPCFAIVKQARNHHNARVLLRYMYIESFNKGLNFELNTLPVINTKGSDFNYQNIRYKRSILSPVQLTNHYPRLSRIQNSSSN